MTEDQNKRYGAATLDMLVGETGGDFERWKRGVSGLIAVQSERISELERKVEALSMPRHIG